MDKNKTNVEETKNIAKEPELKKRTQPASKIARVTKCNTSGEVKILDAPYSGAATVCHVGIGSVFTEFTESDEFGDFISVNFAGFPGFISKEFVEFE